MITRTGFHNIRKLTGLQGHRGLLELRDHVVWPGHIAVGGGQAAVAVPSVLAVFVHQLVEQGLHVVAGLELAQQVFGQGLLLGVKLVGSHGHIVRVVGYVFVRGLEQNVLDGVNPVVSDVLLQIGIGGFSHQLVS